MRQLFTLCAALMLGGCVTATPAPVTEAPAASASTGAAQIAAETDRLNAWFAVKYEEQLRFNPILLTFLGRKELYDQLNDLSEQGEITRLAWSKASVDEMVAKFRYELLTDEAKMSYDIWKYQYEMARDAAPFRVNRYMFDQTNGEQSFFPTFLINFHRVDTDADMLAYIARVNAVATAMDQLLERAKKSAGLGIRPPKFAYEGVIDQARKVISGAPFGKGKDAALWADMQSKTAALLKNGMITQARAKELKALSRTALTQALKPSYDKLIAWVRSDLPKALVNPSGVGSTQANGKAYYEQQLAANTTTHLSADQIHDIGLREVARLRGEMIALKDRVGFKGDLAAFFKFLDTDPRFHFPNTDAGRKAYLDDATAVIANIKTQLPNYFGILPKADLVVKRVEPFREQPGAAQHYYAGTPDGSRPGIYYVHLADVRAMPKTELEVVAYHEGLPGHHMQISISQELTSVPLFRTQADFTAYQEGWALYSEYLAKEMPNTYQDPYSDFGRLNAEMWRSVRLVVDTGLHAKGWTERQAIEYFERNTSIPAAAVKSEVQRYLVDPGQATAYKIGMLKIQELRRKSESALGERFDIKGFHDTVLSGGALPLELLERRVDTWIATRKLASSRP